ncbi:restriction endonuclease subunit S [Fusobacterium nucleatum]
MKIFNKNEWKKVKLEDICDILDSKRIPISEEKRIKGEYPYYGANGIQGYINDYIFDEELILLAEDGGNFGSKTKPIAYKINGKTWVNNHAHVLKAKNEIISTDFLLYSLMFYDVTKLIAGTTRKKLTRKGMEKISLLIPNLDVQDKITNYLKKIENFISFRKNQLNYLKELAKSLFKAQFFSCDKSFEKKKLKDSVIEMFIGPFGSDLKNETFVEKEKGYCVVYEQKHAIKKIIDDNIRYITKEKYETLKRFRVDAGDIIVSCRGTIGRIFILPNYAKFGIIHPSLMKIKLKEDKYKNTFFEKLLEKYMQENLYSTQGSSIKMAITAKKLGEEYFILPPIELQNKFVERVEKIEKLSFEIEKSIKEAENLYNSLMNKYFE